MFTSSLHSSDPTWWRKKRIKKVNFACSSAIFVYGGHIPHAVAADTIATSNHFEKKSTVTRNMWPWVDWNNQIYPSLRLTDELIWSNSAHTSALGSQYLHSCWGTIHNFDNFSRDIPKCPSCSIARTLECSTGGITTCIPHCKHQLMVENSSFVIRFQSFLIIVIPARDFLIQHVLWIPPGVLFDALYKYLSNLQNSQHPTSAVSSQFWRHPLEILEEVVCEEWMVPLPYGDASQAKTSEDHNASGLRLMRVRSQMLLSEPLLPPRLALLQEQIER